MSTALARLAQRFGIAVEHHDIWGHLHRVPDASLRATLTAMGVAGIADGDDDHGAARAVEREEARRWQQIVAAAIVVRRGERPWRVRIHLPSAQQNEPLEWRVVAETGAEHRGAFTPGELHWLEDGAVDGVPFTARELALDLPLPLGYHRLSVAGARPLAEAMIAVVPERCHMPAALERDGRIWGITVQLYSVRSARNWGIGDFTDLCGLIDLAAARGADIVGLNPLHALFPHDPARSSPYSPSSRLFRNWIYLDVEACTDFRESGAAHAQVESSAFQARLQALRECEYVDYPGVAAAKVEVLEALWSHFRAGHLARGSPRARSFRGFQAAQGRALRLHALFEALQEHFHRTDPAVWGWPVWPEAYRDPSAPAVAEFENAHRERVEFFEYLQWLADLQCGAAARRTATAGMAVGLYTDLAVSVDRSGAEAWANQGIYATAASVGAPPDGFSLSGQNWGLPPVVPERLRESAYAPFIATLRANMRHAGALRIDHVMGLMRLFWVPLEAQPSAGAYVHYPLAELLGLLALESRRQRCLVIGEDLGTVPDEVRHALADAGVLSYRLLYFERDRQGAFLPPAHYPAQAIVAASTHDLPTLAGWWEGRDIALRAALGLYPGEAARDAQASARANDRTALLQAIQRQGLLPEGMTTDPSATPTMTPELARSAQAYLARTPAKVLVVQLEDALGEREQANLPGTTVEHPNWSRRLGLALERMGDDAALGALWSALERERGRRRAPAGERPGGPRARIPRATYRIQLHAGFTFADAAEIVPYLAELGISHVYCSPYLRARPGSLHGYDIVDHGTLNPEIGSPEDFDHFCRTLRAHGMGQIADIVPNHMGVMGADNAWWLDVLENGPSSRFAGYFDIDWAPGDTALAGKVLLPILGEPYGAALDRGELSVVHVCGRLTVTYHQHRFPLDPRTYPVVLARARALLGDDDRSRATATELDSLVAAFGRLPERDRTDAVSRAQRDRDQELHKARLGVLVDESPALAQALDAALRQLNGDPRVPGAFDPLHELLEAQAWRIAHWRVAGEEINYRRFFDINDLAALRMEDPEVFEATHRHVLQLVAEGRIDGLRIDHPDGLYDPAGYFRRLQERVAQAAGIDGPGESQESLPFYVVAEKIVAGHEQLPPDWAVHGTTGYRFANVVNGLFVDTSARGRVDRTWRSFVGDEAMDFEEAAYRGKRIVLRSALAGDLMVLARRALALARADRHTRDFTLNAMRRALTDVAASFPVYRTYVTNGASAQDRRFIAWAVGRATRRARDADPSVFEFVGRALLGQAPPGAPAATAAAYRAFAGRFAQLSAPVAAKGIEDTAFYVHNRLVSLNDVGGDPDAFGFTVKGFHRASADRAKRWPHTLLATSTHDNKRSEDVRARIDVISERAREWRLLVRRWRRMNRSRKQRIEGRVMPSGNDEYLLYQTLLGSFPVRPPLDGPALAEYRERIEQYMLKAVHEAKVHTSWMNPDAAYDGAIAQFVHDLLTPSDTNLFLADLGAQAKGWAWFGALNSIAITAIKLSSPGVPDIYQGNELADFSLVDPDNRRPVDFELRHRLLGALRTVAAAADPATLADFVREMLATLADGRLKLWVTWRALALRRELPSLFSAGRYLPIEVGGARARNVVAFARDDGTSGVVVVAGRLFASLGLAEGVAPVGDPAWKDTGLDLGQLPDEAELIDVLTGASHRVRDGRLPVAAALAQLPVALLQYTRAA